MAWYDEAVFYHIYPLGLLGAPKENNYDGITHRLRELFPWVDHIKKTFKESVNDIDKSRNQMNVIVNNKSEEEKNISFLQKSKYVICPECKRIFFLQLMILRFHSMIVKMDTK